jgi:hypothetical protein
MDYTLIANFSPTVHLYADKRNYILIIRENVSQLMKNGYHTYFSSLSGVFKEIFEYKVRANLANGLDKDAKEMIKIIDDTRKYVLDLIEPYEQLKPNI